MALEFRALKYLEEVFGSSYLSNEALCVKLTKVLSIIGFPLKVLSLQAIIMRALESEPFLSSHTMKKALNLTKVIGAKVSKAKRSGLKTKNDLMGVYLQLDSLNLL